MTPQSDGSDSRVEPFFGWLAHDDDNEVRVLYSGYGDTRKQTVKYLASLIRRGLTVREITDEDRFRASKCWGNVVGEKTLRTFTASPVYDPDDPAAHAAEAIMAARDGRPDKVPA